MPIVKRHLREVKTYRVIGKGEPTPNNPIFIQFGKTARRKHGHKEVLGEIIKRTEPNPTYGYPEKKVLIQFHANSELSQDDIIKEIRKGKTIKA